MEMTPPIDPPEGYGSPGAIGGLPLPHRLVNARAMGRPGSAGTPGAGTPGRPPTSGCGEAVEPEPAKSGEEGAYRLDEAVRGLRRADAESVFLREEESGLRPNEEDRSVAAVVRRVMERVRAESIPGSFSRTVEEEWGSRITTDAERALRAVVETMDGVTAVECSLSPMAGRGAGPWFETWGTGEGAGGHRSVVPLRVRVELAGGAASSSSEALDEVRERVREEAVGVWGLDVRAVDVLTLGPGAEEPAGCDGREARPMGSSLPT